MKRLFEIITNSLGESYVRCYAWAENEHVAVLMFRGKHPELESVGVKPLFAADSPTFITNASDSGFELEVDTEQQSPAFGCVGSTIRLRSGRYLDLSAPEPDQFTFADIAGALSKICRFGGQVDWFYSVAEHSYHCAHQAKLDGHSVDVQRAVLMHDAAEAFIGDVIKPLKQLLGNYREIEAMIEAVIAKKYGLNFIGYGSIVSDIDHAMLIHERQQLFTPDDVKWVGEDQVRKVSDEICLHGWDAAHAEGIFTIAAKWMEIEVDR